MPLTPEQQARQRIDAALAEAGWIVQNRDQMNLAAGPGVAVREFRMALGHGFADYMLFVGGEPAGVLESKPVGYTLPSVELQVPSSWSGFSPNVAAIGERGAGEDEGGGEDAEE